MTINFKGPGDLANSYLDYLYEVENNKYLLSKEMYSVKDDALSKLQLTGIHPKFLEDLAVCISFSLMEGCQEAENIAKAFGLTSSECFSILGWEEEFIKERRSVDGD